MYGNPAPVILRNKKNTPPRNFAGHKERCPVILRDPTENRGNARKRDNVNDLVCASHPLRARALQHHSRLVSFVVAPPSASRLRNPEKGSPLKISASDHTEIWKFPEICLKFRNPLAKSSKRKPGLETCETTKIVFPEDSSASRLRASIAWQVIVLNHPW